MFAQELLHAINIFSPFKKLSYTSNYPLYFYYFSEKLWKTDLDWLIPHQDRMVILHFLTGNLLHLPLQFSFQKLSDDMILLFVNSNKSHFFYFYVGFYCLFKYIIYLINQMKCDFYFCRINTNTFSRFHFCKQHWTNKPF